MAENRPHRLDGETTRGARATRMGQGARQARSGLCPGERMFSIQPRSPGLVSEGMNR